MSQSTEGAIKLDSPLSVCPGLWATDDLRQSGVRDKPFWATWTIGVVVALNLHRPHSFPIESSFLAFGANDRRHFPTRDLWDLRSEAIYWYW